ncbi:hypothetical protein L1077_09850 [Pseudoalteromonas luteoviolacea]|uniref:RHS repeat-associated core domain-containing protein n=1 Tax=Pseudoalteromonas luteoviolacea TaxID=43657 RepID=UPI001F435EEB|nr:RHS repeat-associated core domain-containing protein [Pseudoalteromonas luteoviolacea]MCF6439733.1 hypothetical protein [Pseudoalteromonas luteoviolacea]
MNGRIFDADTGRFMQADPFVQAPSNLQNYNAYSYVLNNPLSYTDPSGYLFKKLGKFLKKNWRTIAAIGGAYVTFGLTTGAWTFGEMAKLAATELVLGGAAAGAVNGAISTGTLKGALTGAASGAIFGAIGGAGLGGFEGFAISGLAGGMMSVMQDGKFGHGFISAGIGSATGGMFGKGPLNRIIGSAIVGGTVSTITGGKFANGAMTAAFATVLRADWGEHSHASGKGNLDFETEGTEEERLQRFKEIKGDEKRVVFKDIYVGREVTEKGKIVLTEFENATKFKTWLRSSPAGSKRGYLNAEHINYFITDKIILYRTAVMGFSGSRYLPNGESFTRNFTPLENGHVLLGHEIAHRHGIDTGNNLRAHVNANLEGIKRCKSFSMCGD